MRKDELLDLALEGRDVDAPEDVRELATLAEALRQTWNVPSGPQAGKGWVLAMEAYRAADPAAGNGVRPVVVPMRRPRRLLAAATLAAALVVALAGGAVAGSQGALPGDLLYPVKLAVERARLAAAGDPTAEARVLLEIAGERLEEVREARAEGNEEALEEAAAGYEEALAAFGLRIAEARAQGLPIDSLVQAAESFPPGQVVSDMTPGHGDGSLIDPPGDDEDQGGPGSGNQGGNGNGNGNDKPKDKEKEKPEGGPSGHGPQGGHAGGPQDEPSEEPDDPGEESVDGEDDADEGVDGETGAAEDVEGEEDEEGDDGDGSGGKKAKPTPSPAPSPSSPGKSKD